VGLSIWKTGNLAIGLLPSRKTLPSLVGSKGLFRVNNEVEDNVGKNFNYPKEPRELRIVEILANMCNL